MFSSRYSIRFILALFYQLMIYKVVLMQDVDHNWAESFILFDSCEPQKSKGKWCEWDSWGPCETSTCTRKRIRQCNCPQPSNWKENLCPMRLNQNEFYKDNVIKSHTRLVRKTRSRKFCKFPFFHLGEYYGDCSKIGGMSEPSCENEEGHIEGCNRIIYGMEEKDFGACGDWRVANGWSQHGAPSITRTIISAQSKVGKLCINPKLHTRTSEALEKCEEHFYYSETGQRNVFSNLNNLAFNIENCRFACAIETKCVGIEFAKEAYCAILTEYKSEYMERQLGTITERKPLSCRTVQENVDILGYPYSLALHNFYLDAIV